MSDVVSFGAWIRLRRRALDLTQEQLADLAACAPITIRKIEAEERRPSHETAVRLAEVLRIPLDQRELFLKVARANIRAERLAELGLDDGPAPHSGRSILTYVPAPLTTLIGREDELAHAAALLRHRSVRLLTLSGPGGVGKTRLALALAHTLASDFADGVAFAALASIPDPELVPTTIAMALGIPESNARSPLASLIAALHGKQVLLVLDNFEQVALAASAVSTLLMATQHLKILVSSRAVLHLSGEHEFLVPPLIVPDIQRLPTFETQLALIKRNT